MKKTHNFVHKEKVNYRLPMQHTNSVNNEYNKNIEKKIKYQLNVVSNNRNISQKLHKLRLVTNYLNRSQRPV